ncbi:hypothetical protein APC39_15525 [Acinetobacter pittii]|uniref:hypothetical protein n=1 Tax=Acinetobacter pittii TaxID=48296 RepID=UPI0007073DF8|nr:hypothetical protein [Acinetobacter pittii]KQG36993.1 hypothetical protein APC39_15525 [Acinetobacter pittii]
MDKKALQEQFEEFARWYVLPLDKSEDGIYRALETQSAWMSFQHLQAKVEELQKRVEVLIQKYKDEDRELKLIDEWEQSTIYGRIAIEIEQALKGEG